MKRYEIAANSRDFSNVVPFLTKDAVFWFSDGSFTGLDEIRTAFENTWKAIKNEGYRIDGLAWPVDAKEFAVCIYSFTSSGTVNGGYVVFTGRGTNVLIMEAGEWKIVHEHLSRTF